MQGITFTPENKVFKTNSESMQAKPFTPYEAQQSFASFLKNSIEKVNEAQGVSDKITEKMARGDNIDLHQVMIASQKASITMQATIEMRNKVVEAYQEVMRMSI
ncbi:flagellar hook-basal body complex protein FliE [Peribacillus cavernae]|uniref:Flagellar hook-basal body complex protein FliE n=1 Tax=Peribacillus cavernae TaxID=1674310 RepID=A0A3S0VLN9_9BACI|nr:flagellar hook-basal body complex protein FliE [Peribacillus cavernae]MDQ0217079.1 flagellar hook-basal body complex protein FliE [Peribacillus cavernae]RUQ30443.1 flagellar hook-basal body complex protein FliE [Peribacillus cavernae]